MAVRRTAGRSRGDAEDEEEDVVHRDPAVTLPLTARSRRDEVERRDHAAAANDRRTGRRMRRRTRSTVRGSPRHRAHDSRRPPTALRRACSGGSAVREALTVGASPGSGGGRDVEWFHINRLCDPLGRHSRHSESRMLVMWWVWPRRGPYEPEFETLARDGPGSRQNRDRIGPRPGISPPRMCPLAACRRARVNSHRAGSARLRSVSRCLADLAFGPGFCITARPVSG